jgi:oligopeptide/dipeptide ABC transporter ATP-binding protein
MSETLIRVENLQKYFPIRQGIFSKVVGQVKAVDDVSFSIQRGETLGLVGESGCGKTTTGRAMLRLVEPTAGRMFFRDQDIFGLARAPMLTMRKKMQIIFQDPYGSLNPRITVGGMLREILRVHKLTERRNVGAKVDEILEMVGLAPHHKQRYPHEFSGGQRQRIGIARALSVSPEFIVADEPVSALDVSIQAQIINLLQKLQAQLGLTYLFISHDMGVIRHISNRVAVMYLGRIVEMAACDDLFNHPLHPYTVSLLSAIPVPDPERKRTRIILGGDVPSPAHPPAGCPFHPRCSRKDNTCTHEVPHLKDMGNGHWAACLKIQ